MFRIYLKAHVLKLYTYQEEDAEISKFDLEF